MTKLKQLKFFFNSEKAGGFVLLICTVVSLVISNSSYAKEYMNVWHVNIGDLSLTHWINDGLMTVFFLFIGLELEREIYKGELSNLKNALLPIFGAVGGVLFPALFFLLFNYGTSSQSGVGIPLATDIAFALGILSLLGKGVPISIKYLLTALAVIDDLFAIIIIAVFYSTGIVWTNLLMSLGIFLMLLALKKLKVAKIFPYLIGGVAMWYFMLSSGVHATITGVLLAFAIPFNKNDKLSPSYTLFQFLHKPVAFIVLPAFAMANTAISFNGEISHLFSHNYSIGIALGLILGKPLGIFLFTFISVKIGFCKLPHQLNWRSIIGLGFLAGIGFTMSIFITLLAFSNLEMINNSKLVIILSSFISGLLGVLTLRMTFVTKKV